jgi:hypothetical protein
MPRNPHYDDARLDRDHRMMSTPVDWPCWPFLPIKRWRNDTMELAVLYAIGDPSTRTSETPVIFLQNVNLWMLPGPDVIRSAPRRHPSELIAEGWVVD